VKWIHCWNAVGRCTPGAPLVNDLGADTINRVGWSRASQILPMRTHRTGTTQRNEERREEIVIAIFGSLDSSLRSSFLCVANSVDPNPPIGDNTKKRRAQRTAETSVHFTRALLRTSVFQVSFFPAQV
jgi:hypothetical protein